MAVPVTGYPDETGRPGTYPLPDPAHRWTGDSGADWESAMGAQLPSGRSQTWEWDQPAAPPAAEPGRYVPRYVDDTAGLAQLEPDDQFEPSAARGGPWSGQPAAVAPSAAAVGFVQPPGEVRPDPTVAVHQRRVAEGPEVLFHLRTHPKVLFLPMVWSLVAAVGVAAAARFTTGNVRLVGWAIVLGAWVWFSLVPYLRWRFATYTITETTVKVASGILYRKGRDLPIARVVDVGAEQGILDRIFGCGTLVIADASGAANHNKDATVRFRDIPHVAVVKNTLHDLIVHRPGQWGT